MDIKSYILRFLSAEDMTLWVNKNIFSFLNGLPGDLKILNLGSGSKSFDQLISKKMIDMDIQPDKKPRIIGDAHQLPFPANTFDVVFSNAVLEHVKKPWVVSEEIWRVLKEGGYVMVNVPFLNIIHDEFDYYRFTDKGLEVIFERFENIEKGVSAGGASFLNIFLIYYFVLFFNRKIRKFIKPFLIVALRPLKYLDLLLKKDADLRLTADSFYFIGRKN